MMFLQILFIVFIFQTIRYFLFAGGAYAYFWSWKRADTVSRRFQNKDFTEADLKREIIYSIISSFVFAFVLTIAFGPGMQQYAKAYSDLDKYGLTWAIITFFLLAFWHDAYFFWTHRVFHHPALMRRFHFLHHESKNPSPFAALSFHPVEAVVQIAWIVPILYLVPVYRGTLFVFSIFALALNVMGHLGVEVYPESWRKHFILKYVNRSKNHNLHHERSNTNYGLYFNYWDRIFGTFSE